ncbi:hypothetical protein HHO41_06625 [Bacillus sp. DNRA2]|uniref:hypothetical protein n=1 Tax=Bacillus sp. DNRA2 TaxID=2723053 RepID=UPI00145FD12E|nr:hypothetical protein [Bacillus sp. DNRA2]NMD69958.1 hypothetical protein [Bacillus sp. DNRA2]
MVNEEFEKFNSVQKKHQSAYVSNETLKNNGSLNKDDYNTQSNTDKSIGTTGRQL